MGSISVRPTVVALLSVGLWCCGGRVRSDHVSSAGAAAGVESDGRHGSESEEHGSAGRFDLPGEREAEPDDDPGAEPNDNPGDEPDDEPEPDPDPVLLYLGESQPEIINVNDGSTWASLTAPIVRDCNTIVAGHCDTPTWSADASLLADRHGEEIVFPN